MTGEIYSGSGEKKREFYAEDSNEETLMQRQNYRGMGRIERSNEGWVRYPETSKSRKLVKGQGEEMALPEPDQGWSYGAGVTWQHVWRDVRTARTVIQSREEGDKKQP